MKFVNSVLALPLFCLLLVTSGCLKESESVCIRENTTLLFHLLDLTTQADIFPQYQYIHSVDAYIFNDAKKMVKHRRFEEAELKKFPGWKLDLPPGDYYAVCWGNADDNSQLRSFTPSITTFDEGYIEIPPGVTTGGNPIYYAPYKVHPNSRAGADSATGSKSGTKVIDPNMVDHAFTVLFQRHNVKDMYFVCAHRTINVYIMGYSSSSAPATVTGTGLCAEYNFRYESQNDYRNFTQTAQGVTTPSGPGLLVTFYVGFSEINSNMNFILRNGPGGAILQEVNLRQFLLDNNMLYNYGNTIDIVIQFYDLGVSVTIPTWGNVPVEPKV